ncbi:phenoloxidase-activating enzyme-like isoform X1 [Ostrinia nubilalis]|uniref:phenoloxidase-activating enzyme-like isoform X1 n=2 Tax=Ostrinia nubilalis TaxID=29057 RepID=UPI00308233A7
MKCCVFICVLLLSWGTQAANKESCETCEPMDNCPFFKNLSEADQANWRERYDCEDASSNTKPIYGFSSSAKGDLVCCPENVWQVENPSPQPSSTERPKQISSTTTSTTEQPVKMEKNSFLNQPNFNSPIYPGYPNGFTGNQFNPGFQGYPNTGGQYPNTGGQYPNTGAQYPNTGAQYPNTGAQYPNSGTQYPNSGAQYPNTGGQYPNTGGQYTNTPLPQFGNQRLTGNQFNNPGPNGNGYQVYENDNEHGGLNGGNLGGQQGFDNGNSAGNQLGNQNGNPYDNGFEMRRGKGPDNNAQNPYFLPADRKDNSLTGTNLGGQCPVTSFPPDPDSGCCGREATDPDSDAASGNGYPQSNWAPHRNQPSRGSRPLWPQSDRVKREDVNITLDNRIAGGKETELEQFPWTVLLKTIFVYPDKEVAFSCGGSLISSRYVLTAGHCIVDSKGTVKDVEIYLAEYDKRTFPKDCKNVLGKGQVCVENIVMHAENLHLHPEYDDNRLHNDIALIRLRGNAPYTDYIRPICLPPINVDSPELSNLRLAVAGWGRNGQYKSNIKQSTVVNLVPQSDCRSAYPGLTRMQVCAAGYTGEDTCKGDSGGPLMMMYAGRYFVSGVVSGKRADAPCGTSVPSLYTNVYQYLPWIRSMMQK